MPHTGMQEQRCAERPTVVADMSLRRTAPFAIGLLVIGAGIGVAIGLSRSETPRSALTSATPSGSASPASRGWAFDRMVPPFTLTSANGQRLSLRSLRGRVIVLAPSLTLCHEICPMTTQALMLLRKRLAAEGRSSRVALVEATVDPWRDSPARLRAYAKLTGARLLQLTGGAATMRRFWHFFGIGFRRAPQGRPAEVDWWTGRRESFDVQHTDGLFLIDGKGYERRFFSGPANVGGRLSRPLQALLSAEGMRSLTHQQEGWTVVEVARALRELMR